MLGTSEAAHTDEFENAREHVALEDMPLQQVEAQVGWVLSE